MLCVKCLTHLFFIWSAVSIYYLFSHFLQSLFLFFIMAQIKFLSSILPELRTRISSVIYKKYKAKYKYVMTVNNVFLFLTYFTFKCVIVVFNHVTLQSEHLESDKNENVLWLFLLFLSSDV